MATRPIAPQAQESNYATVFNIDFRPHHEPLPTGANTKLKCPSCGVWGLKGSTCKVCRTPIPGPRRIYIPPTPAQVAEARNARCGNMNAAPTSVSTSKKDGERA
ncbi:hypothetical protein N2W54_006308 [Lotmaria passim]